MALAQYSPTNLGHERATAASAACFLFPLARDNCSAPDIDPAGRSRFIRKLSMSCEPPRALPPPCCCPWLPAPPFVGDRFPVSLEGERLLLSGDAGILLSRPEALKGPRPIVSWPFLSSETVFRFTNSSPPPPPPSAAPAPLPAPLRALASSPAPPAGLPPAGCGLVDVVHVVDVLDVGVGRGPGALLGCEVKKDVSILLPEVLLLRLRSASWKSSCACAPAAHSRRVSVGF